MCYGYGVGWKPNRAVHVYVSVYVVRAGLTVVDADQQMTQPLSVRFLQAVRRTVRWRWELRTASSYPLFSNIQATYLNLRLQDGTMTGYQQYTDHLRNFS